MSQQKRPSRAAAAAAASSSSSSSSSARAQLAGSQPAAGPQQATLRGFIVRRTSTRSALLAQKLKDNVSELPKDNDATTPRRKKLTLLPDDSGADALSPIKSTENGKATDLKQLLDMRRVSPRRSLQQKFAHLLHGTPAPVQSAPVNNLKPLKIETPVSSPRPSQLIESPRETYTLPHLRDLGADGKASKSKLASPKASRCDDASQRHMSYSRYLRVPIDLRITLPDEFEILDQIFDGLESTISYMLARGDLPIFHRLQRTVQLVCSRTFEISHLASICGVFKEAYIISAVNIAHGGTRIKSYSIEYNHAWRNGRKRRRENDDHVFVDDEFDCKNDSFAQTSSPITKEPRLENESSAEKHHVSTANRENNLSNPEIAALDMPLRRREFRTRLIAIVDAAHQEYLNNNSLAWSPKPAVTQTITPTSTPRMLAKDAARPEEERGSRWHPRFDASNVKLPVFELPSIQSAQASPLDDELSLKCQMVSRRHSLSSSAMSGSTLDSPIMEAKSPSAASSINSPKATGKFSSLLLRIREKEKKILESEEQGLSPAEKDRLTMLSRLPTIASTVKSMFHHNGKMSLPLAKVAQSVSDSYPNPLSLDASLCHLALLGEVAVDFCTIIDVGASKYIRLRANGTVASVIQAAEAARLLIEQPKQSPSPK